MKATRFVVAITMMASPAVALVHIEVGSEIPDEQESVAIDVTMRTDGESVGGMQADLIFDDAVLELLGCRINPDIGLFPLGPAPATTCHDDTSIGPCKNMSSVLNQCDRTPPPEGCPSEDAGRTSVFRAIIVGTAAPNDNEIPAGVLYTCDLRVIDRQLLPTVLSIGNVVVSNPHGLRLDGSGSDGAVCAEVGGDVVCGRDVGAECRSNLECISKSCDPTSGVCSAAATPTATPSRTPPGPPQPTRAPAPLGAFCLDGSFCASGSCIDRACCADPVCPDGQYCNLSISVGHCSALGEIGDSCLNAGDCLSFYCDRDRGRCEAMPTRTATPTATLTPEPQQDGAPCRSDLHCISEHCVDRICCASAACVVGQGCNTTHSPGICAERQPFGEGCEGNGDCSSGNCDFALPDPPFFGSCGAFHTPTPSFNGGPFPTPPATRPPCVASNCPSGFCVDGVCCREAACEGVNRCDILGFEGRCVPPLFEGAGCVTNSDCVVPLVCERDGLGVARCSINEPTPTFLPTRTTDDGDDAEGNFGHIADDGCQLSENASTSTATWVLAVVALLLFASRPVLRVTPRRIG
jgi:hypothetical protein